MNRNALDAAATLIVDARGESCPMPLLKTKRAINGLSPGQSVCVLSTDSGSVKDIRAYSEQSGNRMTGFFEETPDYIFYLEKA